VFNAVDETTFEVLGVVADVRITEVGRAPEPQMYYPYPTRPSGRMNLVVRARGAPEALVPGIRRVVLGRDPDVPFSEVATMSSIISESIAPERVLSVATGLFALTALVLSLTGLYAVLAYYVALRSQEIGIRVAFGADARDVLGLVLRKGMVLVGGGLAAGILGAAIVTRALQSLLYQVTATDPVTFLGVALGFTVVGLLASWVPARKATKVDPVRVIKAE
jgi:predicted lysophospholipase L1 biosynthesis ABC-type transport system permease subunit